MATSVNVDLTEASLISSGERSARARRLMARHEIIGIVCFVAVVILQLAQIRAPSISHYDKAVVHQNVLLVPHGSRNAVRAVDIETGRSWETKLTAPEFGWIVDGDVLWGVGSIEVTKIEPTRTSSFRPARPIKKPLCRPFLYNQKPAIIDSHEPLNGLRSLRLLIFSQPEWRDLGEIAVPGPFRTWSTTDAEINSRLVPRTQSRFSSVPHSGFEELTVIDVLGHSNVFYRTVPSEILAYRDDFDFVNRKEDAVSALAPRNLNPDTTGWKKLSVEKASSICIGVLRGEVVLSVRGTRFDNQQQAQIASNHLLRQVFATQNTAYKRGFQEVTPFAPGLTTQVLLATDGGNGMIAIADRGIPGSSARVFRYHDGSMRPLRYRLECAFESIYGPLWRMVQCSIAIVVFLTIALALKATRLREQSECRFIQRGHDSVLLASLTRRFLAKGVDALLVLGPLLAALSDAPFRLDADLLNSTFVGQGASELKLDDVLQFLDSFRTSFFSSLFIWLILIVMQAFWGLTPGKMLCGIRVVTTRLHPCGLARSLLRELLMSVDMFELGTFQLLVTEFQQRIGDQYADTVVVDRASLSRVTKGR
jgi:uncharacterized RDD family membrane protein YckC